MDAITYAIKEIKNSIPVEILHEAMFFNTPPNEQGLVSLDYQIRNKIIKGVVKDKTDITGGQEHTLILSGLTPTPAEPNCVVYDIPSDLTGNREIISVSKVIFTPFVYGSSNGMLPTMTGGIFGSTNGTIANSVNRVQQSDNGRMVGQNVRVDLIGYNKISLRGVYVFTNNIVLHCTLENNDNFSNLPVRAFDHFAKLCILAAKRYVYNTLIVPINLGKLVNGQELGIFKSIVEDYSSASEDMEVYIKEQWRKIAFMADREAYSTYIKAMTNPGI